MNDRPTPETDEVQVRQEGLLCGAANLNFARKLERERDEAREQLRQLANTAVYNGNTVAYIYDKNQAYKTSIDKLVRERDEAIDKYQSLQKTFEEWQLKFLSEQAELLHNKDVQCDKLFDEAHQIIIERDEARRELNEIRAERDLARLSSMESDQVHDRMVGELEKVYKELDKARKDFEEEKKFHNRTHSELVQAQCKLMDLTKTIIDTLEENRHLADGDDCTLAKLKSVVPEWK